MKATAMAACFLITACGGPLQPPDQRADGPSVVASAATTDCTPGDAEQKVRDFVTAFDRHDMLAVDAAMSDALQWVSLTLPTGHEVAYGKSEALRYLARRAEAGDRWSIGVVQMTPERGWDRSFSFFFRMTLTRDGIAHATAGKGAAFCDRFPGVSVWSMGAP
ncbi:MAG TPA: hypothetical protein VGR46_10910 [Candidatus Limnocylindria bacterium]|nr:hypothetical protein [Candidatus Limnocylindria bacterium]